MHQLLIHCRLNISCFKIDENYDFNEYVFGHLAKNK